MPDVSATGCGRLTLTALAGVPLVRPGDDIAAILLRALATSELQLHDGDVVVIAQKIVSKAEGRTVRLSTVTPSPRALELARAADKDPRLIELILAESDEVVRHRPGVVVVAHRLGYVLANAGIDHSNVGDDEDEVLLLPRDPDRTCAEIRDRLRAETGAAVGVIINDSLGRAWRNGTVGAALGVSGVPALRDLRGSPDLFGRPLRVTQVGHADEIAAAASLLMGQGGEGRPIVVVSGLAAQPGAGTVRDLIRPREQDLFR